MPKVGIACLLVGWAILTHQRVQQWQTPVTLYRSATVVTPSQGSSWLLLAAWEFRMGDLSSAKAHLVEAQRGASRMTPKLRTLLEFWTAQLSGFHAASS